MSRRLSDPLVSSLIALTALCPTAFVVLALTWRGVAAEINVAIQIPYLVSGGLGALALLAFSLGLLAIQQGRFIEARRRADFEEVVAAAAELLTVVRDESVATPPQLRPRRRQHTRG